MKDLKLAHARPLYRVAHLIYSRKVGGSEMVATNVCSHLDPTRFSPCVLFMNKSTGSMPEVLARLGIPHHGFEISRWSQIVRPLIVAYQLRRLAIDILHVHHVPLYRQIAFAARFAKIKGVVLTEHAKLSISRSFALQEWCRRAAHEASFFTVVSEDLRRYFVNELHIPVEALHVIRNGVDTLRFQPATVRDGLRHLLPPSFQGQILISVGRLAEAKDQVTLLKAMSILKERKVDVFLLLVGDGELRHLLESSIRQLELPGHVLLLGNRTDVDALMPQADCFVLSSQREGLPMVVLEAMASGLPIVSTRVGGIPEIVTAGKNGFLVEPGHPDQLADAIERILMQTEAISAMGPVNREKIEQNFSMHQTVNAYQRLYQSILAKAGREWKREGGVS